MLLTAKENGAGSKSDITPDEWFRDKDEEYLDLHCIPRKKSLWKLDNFEAFVDARYALIAERLQNIILDDEEDSA